MKLFSALCALLFSFQILSAQTPLIIYQANEKINKKELGDAIPFKIETTKSMRRFTLIERAKDTAFYYGGNAIVIDSIRKRNSNRSRKYYYISGEIYQLDSSKFQKLKSLQNQNKRNEPQPTKVFVANSNGVLLSSINKKETTNHFLEFGVGYGSDYLLFGNVFISAEFTFLNSQYLKLSLNNKLGGTGLFAFFGYNYYSAKISLPIFDYWLTLSYGRENYLINNGTDTVHGLNAKRIDIGFKIYREQRSNLELSIPLRYDHDFPIYLSGIHANFTHRI